ncbi:MAG: glycosyltransferase [Clostridia bacterium]|nr:glycosyltransferase [Clostridia bacterium]
MAQRKKLAIFQKELWVGGIQKSLLNLIANLDHEKYEIDLYLYDKNIFYDVDFPENVTVHFRKPYPYWFRFLYFPLVFRLKRGSAPAPGFRYDTAIDFNSYQNECAVDALSVPADKRICWVHTDVRKSKGYEKKFRLLWHFFKDKFHRFDEFAAVSGGCAAVFPEEAKLKDKPITVVPNYIDTSEIYAKAAAEVDFVPDPAKINLCTVGRMCYAKGYDLLLDDFAKAYARRPELHLYFIGDGELRQSLTRQITTLGLEDAVTMLGYQSNPFPYMAKMDGFVLTSRYEGQGMVLWEAKALGLPVLIPKHLEAYNDGICGHDDMIEAMVRFEKTEKTPDPLDWYNKMITERLEALL